MDELATDVTNAEPAPQEQPQSIDDFIASQIDAAETPRGDDGKFTSPDDPDQAPVEVTSEETPGDEPGDGEQEAETETTDDPVVIQPPQSMSAKDREAFYKLPPESQKWLTERAKQQEAAFTQKTMDLAEKSRSLEQLENVLAPHRQTFAHRGMTEAQAIGQLLSLADHADKDFVGFVQNQARLRGIPLEAFSNPGQQMQADPNIVALQHQLESVTNTLSQQQMQQQERERASIEAVVEDFAKDPAFPYYADLEADMFPVVAALRQSNPSLTNRQCLERAYRMALAANEQVSAKAEVDRKAKEDAERIKKAKEEAAKAKKASGTNIRSAPSLPAGAAKAENVEDFIGALYDERASA